MEKNELKRQGLAFGRVLQRTYKIVALYTTEHAAAEERSATHTRPRHTPRYEVSSPLTRMIADARIRC